MNSEVITQPSSLQPGQNRNVIFLSGIVVATIILGIVTVFLLGQQKSADIAQSGRYVNYFDQLQTQQGNQNTAYVNPFSASANENQPTSQENAQYQNPFQ